MPSLKELVLNLEQDLKMDPPRHFIYNDLPFALFCYPPSKEWEMRKEMQLLQTRLEQETNWKITFISLADLMWEVVDRTQDIDQAAGMPAITQLEYQNGFISAQDQVFKYLSDPESASSLPNLLIQKLKTLDSSKSLVFLWRAGAFSPDMYRVSTLLDSLKGQTKVSCILFMPAILGEGQVLKYMGLSSHEPRGSYHTKIYINP